jgi:fructose 1,6-bisphosphatase
MFVSYRPHNPKGATIAVHAARTEDEGHAHRIFRDLRDRTYEVYFEPTDTKTLTIIVAWSDGFGWDIRYVNRVDTYTLTSPEQLYQKLYSDFILARQPWVPPNLKRPF